MGAENGSCRDCCARLSVDSCFVSLDSCIAKMRPISHTVVNSIEIGFDAMSSFLVIQCVNPSQNN